MLDAIDARGWAIIEYGDKAGLLLEWWSPAGENICIETTRETLQADLVREYETFDVDEHVDLWAESRGKRGVPDSYAVLIRDAYAIRRELRALSRIAESHEPRGKM